MSIYAISDLHLSFGADKPMNIFRGWDNYTERLEQNWKTTVKSGDTVVLGGDLSWSIKAEDALPDFEFIEKLPGKKLLIKGNHDLYWSTMSKMKVFLSLNGITTVDFVHNNAFAVENIAVCGTRGWFFDDPQSDKKIILREAMRLEASISAAKKTGLEPVVFLHYPPVYGDRVCSEIFSVIKNHDIKRVFYGHIHGNGIRNAMRGRYDGVEFTATSCDVIGFTPIKVSG